MPPAQDVRDRLARKEENLTRIEPPFYGVVSDGLCQNGPKPLYLTLRRVLNHSIYRAMASLKSPEIGLFQKAGIQASSCQSPARSRSVGVGGFSMLFSDDLFLFAAL